MRVIIYFHNGSMVDFIAPVGMLVTDLKEIIDTVGSSIRKLEFPTGEKNVH